MLPPYGHRSQKSKEERVRIYGLSFGTYGTIELWDFVFPYLVTNPLLNTTVHCLSLRTEHPEEYK